MSDDSIKNVMCQYDDGDGIHIILMLYDEFKLRERKNKDNL